ncbi:TetR/AcrR family transcriptional regulator [Streptomyces sp. HNM0663]|uniref:TetR/AcrR family transcriptional regulator n=1 Tax=Streptomyces chengmaiensis TaxID=3040919 RepID=A0ABT6HF41_9ACTN|nr:TetR/AcrR family transcriptional regulator [Streptomyces chengmaiensis]MDH2387278.1 TetR/AcrR family transcriptional regulator [Streptomyces chengmaiensis]
MVSRVESAAATRRALLDAAADLLDSGGPGAVTLREVGARAGVTRGAPYRHFPDKDSLLTAVAAEALDRLADQAQDVRTDPQAPPADKLRRALSALMTIGRRQPHLYRLMFASPAGDPAAIHAATQAGDRAQDEFFAIVGDLVGAQHTSRYAALLLTSVHGITDMEVSGHLSADKWHITAEELVSTLVSMIDRQTRSG